MFALAFAFLLLFAGLIHRALTNSVSQWELDVMHAGLFGLWPVFVLEAAWGVYHRDRTRPRRPALFSALLVSAMPPWRMAQPDPRTGLIWVPRIGWQQPGKALFKRLEKAFGRPMLLFAFLILPLLLVEYMRADVVKESPALALGLDVGIALVWIAFATEFVFKASAHPKPLRFARERWLDAAIVLLPMLEFVLTRWVDAAPLARLLKAGRALSPEQLARMQRLYRLQGLFTKAWHALMLLEAVNRLIGNTPEKRLAALEDRIAEAEEELSELRAEEAELRAQMQPTPPAPLPEGKGEKEVADRVAHSGREGVTPPSLQGGGPGG
jgi:voltage-gated potassium channel